MELPDLTSSRLRKTDQKFNVFQSNYQKKKKLFSFNYDGDVCGRNGINDCSGVWVSYDHMTISVNCLALICFGQKYGV